MYGSQDGFQINFNNKEYILKMDVISDNLNFLVRDMKDSVIYSGEFSYNDLISIALCLKIHYDIYGIKEELEKALEAGKIEILEEYPDISLLFRMTLGVDPAPFILTIPRDDSQSNIQEKSLTYSHSEYRPDPVPIPTYTPQPEPAPITYTPPPEPQPITYTPSEPLRLSNTTPMVTGKKTILRALAPARNTPNPFEKMSKKDFANPSGAKYTNYVMNKAGDEGDLEKSFNNFGGGDFNNSFIKRQGEVNFICNLLRTKFGGPIRFNQLYKATSHGDEALMFHNKCDFHENCLIFILTQSGKKFGGFSTKSWDGQYVQKKDEDAFVFSIDKQKTYPINEGEFAIGCYPEFGPVFMGCQIRIFDECFNKGGTTCSKGMHYKTTEDFELTGQQNFKVSDVEVYEVIPE